MRLKVKQFVYLPDDLQKLWSNIPTKKEIDDDLIDKFVEYLKRNSQKNDYVLVQGDFGMVFAIVDWCLNNNRIPIYSTTERIAKEQHKDDGSVDMVHRFKHVRFREYRRFTSKRKIRSFYAKNYF